MLPAYGPNGHMNELGLFAKQWWHIFYDKNVSGKSEIKSKPSSPQCSRFFPEIEWV